MKKTVWIISLILAIFFLQQEVMAASRQRIDTALLMPATTLMQKIKQGKKLFMVDIRHKTKFNQFKIPGSLNIPMAFIGTKSFLKTRPLVLIHQGLAHGELLEQARALNKKGFEIFILQGGLAAWKHKGGTLVGDPFSPKNLKMVEPKQFFLGKDSEDWIILNACSAPDTTKKNLISKKSDLLALSRPLKTRHTLNDLLAKKHAPTANIILFNETGQNYDHIEKIIDEPYRHRVFFLKGGIEAYEKFTAFQMLANRPKSQRTKEIGHCEPCKENAPQ